jgi:hypothetical protein
VVGVGARTLSARRLALRRRGEVLEQPPESSQFIIAKHSLTRDLPRGLGDPRGRVRFDPVVVHREVQHLADQREHTIRHHRTAAIGDRVDQLAHVTARELGNAAILPSGEHFDIERALVLGR